MKLAITNGSAFTHFAASRDDASSESSTDAKAMMTIVHYRTYAEYLAHPVFKAIKETVMRLANYRCQCGEPATDPHHLRYPAWGTFDVPENLIAVCHACHCKLHGKDN